MTATVPTPRRASVRRRVIRRRGPVIRAQPGKGGGDGMSPEKAGQLASMLPQLIPALLGAAGGLVGGAVQMIGKAPETLMQAGSQMAGQVSQSLGGLMKQGLDVGSWRRPPAHWIPRWAPGRATEPGEPVAAARCRPAVVRCRLCPRSPRRRARRRRCRRCPTVRCRTRFHRRPARAE